MDDHQVAEGHSILTPAVDHETIIRHTVSKHCHALPRDDPAYGLLRKAKIRLFLTGPIRHSSVVPTSSTRSTHSG